MKKSIAITLYVIGLIMSWILGQRLAYQTVGKRLDRIQTK